jgi:hypothetical protein
MPIRYPLLRLPTLFAVLTIVLLSTVSNASSQNQVTLIPSKDNTLYEDTTGSLSNGAGAHFFAGRTNQPSGSIRRGLLAFDIAGALPPGATISSVTLTLNMSFTITGAQTVSINRVLADWGEGTSAAAGNEGTGAQATTGDATWIHRFFNTTPWTTAGGDFASTPSSSQSVDALGPYTWGSTAAMVSDVQGWLDNPSGNFGWIIIGNESTTLTAKRFDSRQDPDTTVRPHLTVTFAPPLGVETEESVVREFALQQNYPNPFNPTTAITYNLPSTMRVSLKLYNVIGQEVLTLANEVQRPGVHTVRLDATDLASGMYFYRLKAGNFVGTRKMLLLK